MYKRQVFALSFAACNDDEEQIPPTDGGNLTFEVTVGEITSVSYTHLSIRALPNFSWTISRDYNQVHINPLDTTLATFRIDYRCV